LKPSAERVRKAVTGGPGTMPAYDSLTPAQIEAVARYVAEAAGG
jgi:sulfite dehydrogenase